jgi:regulator of replication initiation timing
MIDHQKEQLDELMFQNKRLMLQIETLQLRLDQYQEKLKILVRQSDEWAKSYDNLLKDFIAYRNKDIR